MVFKTEHRSGGRSSCLPFEVIQINNQDCCETQVTVQENDVLFAMTVSLLGARIYRSRDQGATWTYVAGINTTQRLINGLNIATDFLGKLIGGDLRLPGLSIPGGLFYGIEGEMTTQRLSPSAERTIALLMDGVHFSVAYTENEGDLWIWVPLAMPGGVDRPWLSVCQEKVFAALDTGLQQPAPFTLIGYAGLPPPSGIIYATGQTGYGSSVSLDGGQTWLPRPVQSTRSAALAPEDRGDLRVAHTFRNFRGRLFATAPTPVRAASNLPNCQTSPTILRVDPPNLAIYRGYYPNPIEPEYIAHNLASRWTDIAVDQSGTLYVLRFHEDGTTNLYRSFDYGFSLTEILSFTGAQKLDTLKEDFTTCDQCSKHGPFMTVNKAGQVAIAYRALDLVTLQRKIYVKKITNAHTTVPSVNTLEVGVTAGRLDLLDVVWNSQDKLRIGMVDSNGKPAVGREL